MNRSGLIRQIDKLGRVSIPAEIRRSLNIRERDMVEFSVSGSRVCIERYDTVCFVCGGNKDVETVVIKGDRESEHRFNVCRGCLKQLAQHLKIGQVKPLTKSRLEDLV